MYIYIHIYISIIIIFIYYVYINLIIHIRFTYLIGTILKGYIIYLNYDYVCYYFD